MSALYQIMNLHYSYNVRLDLDIENLVIPEGQIIVLSGPNGSGKTTLLKILNGLYRFHKGIIRYREESIETGNYIHLRKESVFVHQHPYLLEGTVRDNILFGLKMKKVSRKESLETADKIAVLFGLEDILHKRSSELSSGEVQRTALARAVALKPKVLLLDEPTANLDTRSIDILQKIFYDLKSSLNMSILFSSHNVIFSQNNSDGTVWLSQGRIEQVCIR